MKFLEKPSDGTEDLREKGMYATTSNLSQLLGYLKEQGDEKFISQLADMMDHYIEEYKTMSERLKDSPESVAWNWERVVSEHVEINKKDLPASGKTISCKKGCAWCCGQQVTITLPEAIFLVKLEKEGKAKIDWEKVEKQSKESMDPEKFARMSWDLRACALLDMDSKLCTAYENRPSICRTHYSVDDPEKCKTDILQKIEKFIPIYGEAVLSASWNISRTGPMPLLLLEAKEIVYGTPGTMENVKTEKRGV